MKRFETCGLIFDSAIRKRLLKFSRMCFALFVGTDKCFCNLQSVYSVRNRFLTMYQWTVVLEPSWGQKMCALKSLMSQVLKKYISKSVFTHQKVGGSVPQNFCLELEQRRVWVWVFRVGVVLFFQIIPYFLFNITFSEKKIFGVVSVVFFVCADRKNEWLALITFCMKIQTSAKLYRYLGAWV